MAREINKLSAVAVSRLKEPGQYGDGDGLYLVVDSSGAKRWRMLFRHDGRQREMGLGSASIVTLADARRKRDEVRRALAQGRDPIAERHKRDPATIQSMTFGSFADQLVPELCKGFRNAKHAAQWTSTLNTYAMALRSKPIADISTDDDLAVLRPIWTEKSETASRVRGRIEKILDAATGACASVRTQPAGVVILTIYYPSAGVSPVDTTRLCHSNRYRRS